MTNISGNYDTSQEEIDVVKHYLDNKGIKYQGVGKFENADAGDVLVKFSGGRCSLFEVKQERKERWEKFKEFGIDFISSFRFKNGIDETLYKKLCKEDEYEKIYNDCLFNFIGSDRL